MDRRPHALARACRIVAVGVLGITTVGGCSWMGGDKMEPYPAENDRRIGNLRTDRALSPFFEGDGQQLSDRVDSLEQRLEGVSGSLRGAVDPSNPLLERSSPGSLRVPRSTPTAADEREASAND